LIAVSTTRQAKNDLSIPDQLRQLKEYCKSHNLAVASEYVEPGASATDHRRPVFQQMIADATQPPAPFDAILVHSRSRFFRDLFQFLHYERLLVRVGVRVVSITQQTGDDAAGEMASKLFSLFDEYHSRENSKHTQRAMQENARQGYWNGSVPPFGYRAATTDTLGNRGRCKRRLELDPLEAETVREIYRLYLAGHDGQVLGMKAIATHLNRQALTMRGRPWRIQKVNRLLADPLYAGCFLTAATPGRARNARSPSGSPSPGRPSSTPASSSERPSAGQAAIRKRRRHGRCPPLPRWSACSSAATAGPA
jgi:DNA invertase Pin-like site-specific DNA recombinase